MPLSRKPRTVAAMLALLLAGGITPTAASADTPEPNWSGLDARFYSGPIPAPGQVISAVPLDRGLTVQGAGDAFRLLYSTINQHDAPSVSTAGVFLPPSPPPEGGFPVIAWAHGTVGLGDDCTPSALPRSERDNIYLSRWLSEGFAVVASDYVGLGTPGTMSYLNGIATAHAVVDSVVAAHAMGLPLASKWAVVGQSQGGGAAIASARWASEFSAGRGLDYRGVVATGTPANIDELVSKAGPDLAIPELGPIANAYTAYILAAFREARPDLPINTVLSPAGLNAAATAQEMCVDQLSDQLESQNIDQFFVKPLNSIPGLRDALAAYMGTPTSGFDRPVFLGVGLDDHDVPPTATLTFYDQLVANNQQVELRIYPDADHDGTVLASLPDSMPFIRKAFTS